MVVAANGQKRLIRQFELQDDQSGSHFTFDDTGSYSYAGCEDGLKLEGTGEVTIKGCVVTLVAVTPTRLVQAELNPRTRSGNASILLETACPPIGECAPLQVTVNDSNTQNNTPECKPAK